MQNTKEASSNTHNETAKRAGGFGIFVNMMKRVFGGKEDSPAVKSPIVESPAVKNKPKGGGVISPAMITKLCALGDKIYVGTLPLAEAKRTLTKVGMSAGSAHINLNNYRAMLAGEVFKRTMKFEDFKTMLIHIKKTHGAAILKNAIKASRAHIAYAAENLKNSNVRMGRLKNFLDELDED